MVKVQLAKITCALLGEFFLDEISPDAPGADHFVAFSAVPVLYRVFPVQVGKRAVGDVDLSRLPARLHPVRDGDRVGPHVELPLLQPQHPAVHAP